jgi:pimeloyl-ACP methyl ester carboxylesterase
VPHFNSNGLRIFYEEHGSGESLVLVAGFGMDIRSWEEQLGHYSRYFRVILLELRGAGQSEVPKPGYGVSTMAVDVLNLVNTLGLDRIHFAGFSLGGAIGLEFGIAHSDRLRSLSLHSTWEASEPYSHMQRWIEVRRRIMLGNDPITNTGTRIASFFSPQFINRCPERIEAWVQQQQQNPYPMTPDGVEGHATAIQGHDVRGRLENITAPTLVTVGSQDRTTLPEAARYLHEHIPHSEIVVIDGAAHCTIYEKPEEFASVSMGFLLKHSGR